MYYVSVDDSGRFTIPSRAPNAFGRETDAGGRHASSHHGRWKRDAAVSILRSVSKAVDATGRNANPRVAVAPDEDGGGDGHHSRGKSSAPLDRGILWRRLQARPPDPLQLRG